MQRKGNGAFKLIGYGDVTDGGFRKFRKHPQKELQIGISEEHS